MEDTLNDYTFIPFENIDRLLLVELRESNMPVGIIPQLYPFARLDGEPLSYLTAKVFVDQPKSKVGIVTGVVLPGFMPHGEIDGLPGAVILGRALTQLGHEVSILTEEGCVQVIKSLNIDLGANIAHIINSDKLSDADIEQLAQDLDIGVAIEKIGVNRVGFAHSIEGQRLDENPGPYYADKLITRMNELSKTTIGYGDGGNEIGFGKLYDKAREIAPFGARCQCPCEDGMVTATATGILWPVNVSNFGAYGTVAGLAILTEQPEMALTADELLKALDISVAAGAVDGGTGLLIPGEDGIPAVTAAAIVQVMYSIVQKNFQKFERPF